MTRLRVATICVAVCAGPAFAGPPYFTDDPDPTDLGHWEIYAFGAATRSGGHFDGGGLDLNYGGIADVQLTATLPVDVVHDASPRTGLGDIELGVKYRFFHDERAGFAIAAFPRVILPTATARHGHGRAALLLPVWAQKDDPRELNRKAAASL